MWFYTLILVRGTRLRVAFCPYGRPCADRGVRCEVPLEFPDPQDPDFGKKWLTGKQMEGCSVWAAPSSTKALHGQEPCLQFLRKTKLIDKTQGTITYIKAATGEY